MWIWTNTAGRSAGAAISVWLAACASTATGAHPDDMSAAEHRQHARAHDRGESAEPFASAADQGPAPSPREPSSTKHDQVDTLPLVSVAKELPGAPTGLHAALSLLSQKGRTIVPPLSEAPPAV